MKTIKSKDFGTMRVKNNNACGDAFMGTETINGIIYNIYLGYCGYTQFYAIEK